MHAVLCFLPILRFKFQPHVSLQPMTGKAMDPLVTGIIGFKQAEMASKIQFAVAKKMLDQQKAEGAAALQLLEAAGKSASQAGDSLVAAATGLGGAIDTYA